MWLKTLRSENFRGILGSTKLSIKKGGLLILGDNGTGKSSFIDAIEKALTNKCGSIERGIQGVTWKKHGKHLKSLSEPRVDLIFTDGNNEYPVCFNGIRCESHEACKTVVEAAQRGSFILRRRTLLKFIEDAPKDRYLALSRFFNLNEYEGLEDYLRGLSKRYFATLTKIQGNKQEHLNSLKDYLNIPKESSSDKAILIGAINKILHESDLPSVTAFTELDERITELRKTLSSIPNIEKYQSAKTLRLHLDDLMSLEILTIECGDYKNAQVAFEKEEQRLKGSFYEEVLRDGLLWIEKDKLEKCPLCNNIISLDKVKEFVHHRLKKNQKLIELRKKTKICHAGFIQFFRSYKTSWDSIITLYNAVFDKDIESECVKKVSDLEALIELHNEICQSEAIKELWHNFVDSPLKALPEAIREQVCTFISNYPEDEKFISLHDCSALLVKMNKILAELRALSKREKRLQKDYKNINVLVKVAEDARKQAVEKFVKHVSQTADRYFRKIHFGENIGGPELNVPPRGKGSLELKSNYFDKKDDPRGFFSEGHLDSLGLCLFLAVRRFHYQVNPGFALLILDDVLHSIDGEHRRATAKLIFEEFQDHQLIITTHDSLWFNYLKKEATKSQRECAQCRIADWTIEDGPYWGDPLNDYEWLKSDNSRTAKASEIVITTGRLLEELMQNLCHNLKIAVVFNIYAEYTIEPLWSSFYSHTKKPKHAAFYESVKDCVEDINDLRSHRHFGAHWKELASQLSASEAKEFATAVIKLWENTFCDECGRFIKRIADLKGVWSCECQNIKYERIFNK